MRMSEDLKQMLAAVAIFEDRNPSDIVRIALKYYMNDKGYFDPDFIQKWTAKENEAARQHSRKETP